MPSIDWDPLAEKEYTDWVDAPATSEDDIDACLELWAILIDDVCEDGPGSLPQCQRTRRRNGNAVDLYCLYRKHKSIVVCFAYDEVLKEVRVVYFNPTDPNHVKIAEQRAAGW